MPTRPIQKMVELLDRDATDFGDETIRAIRVVGNLYDKEGSPLSKHTLLVADDFTTGLPSPESAASRVYAPDRFELTKHQAQHVFDVLRDADMDQCPECGPIKADLEGWLKR